MPDDLITAVERSKKGAVVTLNGEEKIFVSRALLIEREFTEGLSLQRDELAQWLLPRQYPEALNLAVSLLAQRARSSGEIEQKLRDRFYLPETVEMVLYKLEKEHFLNDEAFATEYAASLSRRQMGRTRITQELRRKGIAPALIQQALESLDAEEADGAALVLARKLLRRYERESDPRKAMQKLLMAMARRGYGFEEARAAATAGDSGTGGLIFPHRAGFPEKSSLPKTAPRLTTFCQLSIIDTIGNPRLFVHEQTGQTAFKIHKHNTGGNTNGNQNDR